MEHELQQLGYQIVAISPDRPVNAGGASLGEDTSSIQVLSDSHMDAARAFGVSFQVDEGMFGKLKRFGIDLVRASGRNHKQLPVPSVFVVGTDGKVTFQYVNPDYSQRLHPDVLLAVARSGVAQNPRKAKH